MKKLVLAGLFAAAAAFPAFAADDCATLAGKVDEAMKTATVDDAAKTKAMTLAEQAKAAEAKGDAAACTASYTEALKTLGM